MFCFLVLCDRNYASRFRVLYNSIKVFHPEAPIVMATWDAGDWIPKDVEILPIVRLESNDSNYRYSRPKAQIVNEALKAYEHVVYLGCDMEFMAPLPPDTPWEPSVVLVPHASCPIQAQGQHPNDCTFLIAGEAQGDFQIWRRCENTTKILAYYEERLDKFCRYEPHWGWHWEQTWLSRFPWIFDDCMIWKSHVIDVGYWNAKYYGLRRENGVWLTDQGPLVLPHFTGMEEHNPDGLSKHQTGHVATPDIAPLYREYAEKLRAYKT